MPDAATRELREFYNYIWGEEKVAKITFVYLPVLYEGKMHGYMFEWPRQRDAVIRHTLKWSATPGANVFYSPALFKVANPQKENVLGSWVLWVDFDGNAPGEWSLQPVEGQIFVPPPTLIVQSSIPGHEHCYWRLDEFLDNVTVLEDRNRGLAYTMKADTSGWDADQVLRPPRTMNHKRNVPVTIKSWEK